MAIVKLKSGHSYHIDDMLKANLDSLIYNVDNDYDFVIVISGNNMVRVGKSVLGMQVGAYLADKMGTPFGLNNINMVSKQMIDFAHETPKKSVVIYDEAAEGLRANKSMQKATQDIIDFFDECGQMNHIFIIVAPNFFSLKREIAVDRSEFLLNVYRTGKAITTKAGETVVKLQRGQYQFFDRIRKKDIYEQYLKSRLTNYSHRSCIHMRFPHTYTVDEQAYRAKKRESLTRIKEVEKPNRYMDQLKLLTDFVHRKYGYPITKLVEDAGLTMNPRTLQRYVKEMKEADSEWGDTTNVAVKKELLLPPIQTNK